MRPRGADELTTAERLFAKHGVEAVSNRQVSEAAGQSSGSDSPGRGDSSGGCLWGSVMRAASLGSDASRPTEAAEPGSTASATVQQEPQSARQLPAVIPMPQLSVTWHTPSPHLYRSA